MKLPRLSHLQATVLATIGPSWMRGEEIRQQCGLGRSTFYLLMKRLEGGSLVRGKYKLTFVRGWRAKEKSYRLTRGGSAELKKVREFYRKLFLTTTT